MNEYQLYEFFGTDRFFSQVIPASTPAVLRVLLRRCIEVQELRRQLASGTLTDEIIRRCVRLMMRDFREGERFEHELGLAALAVALEDHYTPFSEEFLLDLARLRLAELPDAIRVTRACLQQRFSSVKSRQRTFGRGRLPARLPVVSARAQQSTRIRQDGAERVFSFAMDPDRLKMLLTQKMRTG